MFIRKYHVSIVILSTIITLVGFVLAIIAEIESQDLPLTPDERKISTLGFSGILMLFIGFMITSLVQTWVLTHKKSI